MISLALLGLCACAPKPESEQQRVAMHVDAILEFAIEYPQGWPKQFIPGKRRHEGEIRWIEANAVPPTEAAELLVSSTWRSDQAEQAGSILQDLQQRYPGFEISHREQDELPAGESLRILGYTPQRNFSVHTLSTSERQFMIIFSAPIETFADFEQILAGILESFILLEPNGTAHPD